MPIRSEMWTEVRHELVLSRNDESYRRGWRDDFGNREGKRRMGRALQGFFWVERASGGHILFAKWIRLQGAHSWLRVVGY